MMKKILLVIFSVVVMIISCCKSNEHTGSLTHLSRIIIYKTKADYYDKVPVTLNDNKTMIVGYPGKSDIIVGDTLRLPVPLHNNYILDNQGINTRSAFLSISYKEYRELGDINPGELFKSIEDLDPFEEIYDCGAKKSDLKLKELKSIVRGGFSNCNRLK